MMPEHQPTMMHPPFEELLDKVDFSKFTLVSLAARRARQINSYFSQLSEGLGTVVPPQVHSLSHKPVTIALEEINQSKIVVVDPRNDNHGGVSVGDGSGGGELASTKARQIATGTPVAEIPADTSAPEVLAPG
jgi:DNA-directed RNA polymerase subunit omega